MYLGASSLLAWGRGLWDHPTLRAATRNKGASREEGGMGQAASGTNTHGSGRAKQTAKCLWEMLQHCRQSLGGVIIPCL